MVLGSSERGSAANATTTSLVLARSCAGAVAGRTGTAARGRSRETPMKPSSEDAPSGAEFRVEHVAQPVPDEVDAERGQGQGRAGEGGQPPRDVEVVAALRQHAAPRRGRR